MAKRIINVVAGLLSCLAALLLLGMAGIVAEDIVEYEMPHLLLAPVYLPAVLWFRAVAAPWGAADIRCLHVVPREFLLPRGRAAALAAGLWTWCPSLLAGLVCRLGRRA